MKIYIPKTSGVLALLALLVTLNFDISTAWAQGTAFTYEGILQQGSAPQSGTFNFIFTLYNVASGGNSIALPVNLSGVAVKNGAFTVQLDFGAAVWNGQDNWLDIQVQPNGGGGYITLAPRQEVFPTPYAIYAETANSVVGTLSVSQLSGTIQNSQLANSSITINTTTPGLSVTGSSTVPLGGSILLNNTGVTSLTGGGGVTVSASGGAVTLGSTATSANTPNTIVSRDGTGSFSAQNLTLAGLLNLPTPLVTINSGANSLLLGDGIDDLFVGLAAGNLNSGGDNTGLGYKSLQNVTSGNQNTAVGSQSLAADTTGYQNVAVGYLALQKNKDGFGNTATGWESLTANTSGWYDTAIGLWALQSNTTGNNNTAVGYDSLGGNTIGSENTAFGVHANLYNTTGSNNVAVGWWSLNYDTTGCSNIAVGYQAGINFTSSESGNIDIGNAGVGGDNDIIRIGTPGIQTATYLADVLVLGDVVNSNLFVGQGAGNLTTSGYLNTAFGPAALVSDTIGYQNTAVGYQTLYQNTTGYNNSAFGEQALYLNTTGAANTAIGVLAMFNNTNGTANTAEGQQALYSNQDGNDNTAIGFQSLYSSTNWGNTAVGRSALLNISSGSCNIGIGDYAGQLLTTGSSNIDIGNPGEAGDYCVTRIGTPGIQTTTSLAGICNAHVGYGCLQGTAGTTFGNTFNFWWTGNQLHAYIDNVDLGVISITSDQRLKENIEPMTDDALTRVMALKPSSFKYKNIPGTIFQGDGTQQEGFIADELQQTIPSAVNGQKDATTSKGDIQPQTLNPIPVIAVLTKAVQEQQQEIEELKEMVKTLSEKK